ncbi:MAG: tRNA preQ1(34) S-adenosylmethionine ribosyltransferase-isomerase QueA [Ilumatobacteraceae bacterium]
MHIDDIDYVLPDWLIAQTPIEPRDAARLLVDQGSGKPLHRQVTDIGEFLRPDDLLVVNNTRVIPARLHLRRATGGAVEILLLERIDAHRDEWEALIRPGGKMRIGETLYGDDGVPLIEVCRRTEAGDTFMVAMLADNSSKLLDERGEVPLPPYIITPLVDRERYQTVYSRHPGSAAAPTAGLHFTERLIQELRDGGVEMATVDLTVGLDTFAPISVTDPLDHKIHTEAYSVPADTLERCQQARRVVAVGTTATRALESAASTGQTRGRSNLFITPGYDWKLVDLMVTNFHMPKTSLLLMIDSFVGARWRSLYEQAIGHEYRFLSFGDAMLLDRRAD